MLGAFPPCGTPLGAPGQCHMENCWTDCAAVCTHRFSVSPDPAMVFPIMGRCYADGYTGMWTALTRAWFAYKASPSPKRATTLPGAHEPVKERAPMKPENPRGCRRPPHVLARRDPKAALVGGSGLEAAPDAIGSVPTRWCPRRFLPHGVTARLRRACLGDQRHRRSPIMRA